MFKCKILGALFFILPLFAAAQENYRVDTVALKPGNSFRGLSVVNDRVIWVSGNKGTVGRSIDGGKSWKWIVVPGFENAEFRDIEAFDADTALVMASGEPAYILKTYNGGESWKRVYENPDKGMFLDAMEFWNNHAGIVIGDPIDGRFFVARTFDGGQTWEDLPEKYRPLADSGEALFAASGTCMSKLDRDEAIFVTGGSRSRFFYRGKSVVLPLAQGSEAAGANSVAARDVKRRRGSRTLIVVGGDYRNDTVSEGNCAYTKDGGKTWLVPETPPAGYRSCVIYLGKQKVFTCGSSGVDISNDGGQNFRLITRDGYHVCRKAKDGKSVFLAGNGKIAQLVIF